MVILSRVIIISTAALPVFPDNYGGLELVVGHLALGLASKYDVTLITTKGANIDRNKVDVIETIEPDWSNDGERRHYLEYVSYITKSLIQDKNTVILDHTWLGFIYTLQQKLDIDMHIIHTHHGLMLWKSVCVRYPRLVGLSHAHSMLISSQLGVPVRTVWNGIDVDTNVDGVCQVPFPKYLLCLNRITKEKGIHTSIDIARRSGIPLVIAGDDTRGDQRYVRYIIDVCNDNSNLLYLGLVDNLTKYQLLNDSRCIGLITTPQSTWMEAFGLVAVEANNFGKPVLATANGGLMDIIKNGKNGYFSNNIDKLVDHVSDLTKLKASDCIKIARSKFSAKAMTKRYIKLIETVLDGDRW